jgi:hypothetical protein
MEWRKKMKKIISLLLLVVLTITPLKEGHASVFSVVPILVILQRIAVLRNNLRRIEEERHQLERQLRQLNRTEGVRNECARDDESGESGMSYERQHIQDALDEVMQQENADVAELNELYRNPEYVQHLQEENQSQRNLRQACQEQQEAMCQRCDEALTVHETTMKQELADGRRTLVEVVEGFGQTVRMVLDRQEQALNEIGAGREREREVAEQRLTEERRAREAAEQRATEERRAREAEREAMNERLAADREAAEQRENVAHERGVHEGRWQGVGIGGILIAAVIAVVAFFACYNSESEKPPVSSGWFSNFKLFRKPPSGK